MRQPPVLTNHSIPKTTTRCYNYLFEFFTIHKKPFKIKEKHLRGIVMAINDKIKYYRKQNNLTQSQLAELIGVSPQAISKWETGIGYPDLSMIVPLAIALRVSTDELLEYKDGINLNTVKSEWNSMASAYELFNNSPDSYSYTIEWPCIQDFLPNLRGKSILDFGCGTGIFTFLLEKYYPSKIIGLDLSEEMLKIALAKKEAKKSSAQFILGDASKLTTLFDETFDFVFSSTTTHYIQNLNELLENINRVLKNDGTCILSIIHPVYSAQYPIEHENTVPTDDEWVVRYLDQRKRAYIQPWLEYNDSFENQLSRSYHHTMSDYINSILKSGLKIQEIKEPMPPEVWKTTAYGRYNNYIETPTYMVLKLSK